MKPPRDLRVLAWLYVAGGVAALLSLATSRQGTLSAGLLGIPIGVGLLRLHEPWRLVAVAGVVVALLGIPTYAVLAVPSQRFHFLVSGREFESTSLALSLLIAAWLVSFWQYRVLTNPPTRRAFLHE
jgi:hypothetical protein